LRIIICFLLPYSTPSIYCLYDNQLEMSPAKESIMEVLPVSR
jgi:hypothetical protein